ncbi:MAG: IS256 family transposase [Dehalococcoidia bacterium]|nr:IS256 family transposase [Dehalococcoidia bacterium]MDZ4247079.1 IS256 family transposase [Dehalococcoidia bacterium]
MKRIPPSSKLRQEVEEMFIGWETEGHPLDNFVRLGARYMLQVAVEQEVEDYLGRAHYHRASRRKNGWRNGYEPGKVKTADGILEIDLPQLRATGEPYHSRLAQMFRGGSDVLGKMVTEMYVRGLSTRDVENMFIQALGQRLLSRSSVSRITRRLQKDFDTWRKRDLSELRVLYLFLDAIYLPLRQGVKEKEGVLCAYGIMENGKKVLLHLALGSRESYDSWLTFLHDMTARGLEEPLLVTSDKHKGLKKAVREVFSHAFKQPCLAHKMRNILCKLPKKIEKEMKPLINQVYYASSYEEGLKLGHELVTRFEDRYTSAMECLGEDLAECLTYLRFPQIHWKVIRTSNLIERTFGEGRRRTKVIPRFPTESAGLRLLYATLITASRSWKGVRMPPDIWFEIELLKREAFGEPRQRIEKELVMV